jgi:hypothetical protein
LDLAKIARKFPHKPDTYKPSELMRHYGVKGNFAATSRTGIADYILNDGEIQPLTLDE